MKEDATIKIPKKSKLRGEDGYKIFSVRIRNETATNALEEDLLNKLDSFSRDKYDSVIYKRKLRANGVKMISVVENLDDSPESIMLKSVIEGIIRKSGEFIRTHNVVESRNFIDSYIERVIVYDDRVNIIFKVNVFDKATGTVSQMKSEGTKEAVDNS